MWLWAWSSEEICFSEPVGFRGYLDSMKRLMMNKNYILLLITYGQNVGVFYAISTVLNTVIVKNFPVTIMI